MANGDFASTIKLGRPTFELSLTTANYADVVGPFAERMGRIGVDVENLVGEGATNLRRRIQPRISCQMVGAGKKIRDAMRSLYAKPQNLSFIFADNWAIYSEPYTLETTTTFTMTSNPMLRLDKAYNDLAGAAILSGFHVFAGDDPLGAQATTDYFSSFSRSTWVVTLGSSPGAIGTTVYLNYLYTGILCRFSGPPRAASTRFFRDGDRAWDIALELEGV